MAGAAQDNYDTISNLSGDTFLLTSGDEADLENFVQSNQRTSSGTANVSATENAASYAAIATPRATVEENMPPRSATNCICLPLNALTFIRRMLLQTGRALLISIPEFFRTLVLFFKRSERKVSRPKRFAVCNASRLVIC